MNFGIFRVTREELAQTRKKLEMVDENSQVELGWDVKVESFILMVQGVRFENLPLLSREVRLCKHDIQNSFADDLKYVANLNTVAFVKNCRLHLCYYS